MPSCRVTCSTVEHIHQALVFAWHELRDAVDAHPFIRTFGARIQPLHQNDDASRSIGRASLFCKHVFHSNFLMPFATTDNDLKLWKANELKTVSCSAKIVSFDRRHFCRPLDSDRLLTFVEVITSAAFLLSQKTCYRKSSELHYTPTTFSTTPTRDIFRYEDKVRIKLLNSAAQK